MIALERHLQGSILDIGGGGEGIIGRLYGPQVVAIDNRQGELDEAPAGFEKLLMDATDLQFANERFDHVTSFYTLMFMDDQEQLRSIREAVRVLKMGGELHVWDCEIPSAYPEPFCLDLTIQLPSETVQTTYGVGKLGKQNLEGIRQMGIEAGLTLAQQRLMEDGFYLVFRKESGN